MTFGKVKGFFSPQFTVFSWQFPLRIFQFYNSPIKQIKPFNFSIVQTYIDSTKIVSCSDEQK